MRRLMGSDYGEFLTCCVEAFDRNFARPGMNFHPADALQFQMLRQYGEQRSDVLDVGYALAYSLMGMLHGDRYSEYRQFMQVAVGVHSRSGSQERDVVTA
jgi:hypothetical protein